MKRTRVLQVCVCLPIFYDDVVAMTGIVDPVTA